jgi:hypothetical protein
MRRGILSSLTPYECDLAKFVGDQREDYNLAHGARNKNNFEGDSRENHHQSCGAELAACKFFDYFWTGHIGDYKARDCGPFQVRQTWRELGSLILHPEDHDQHQHILVTGVMPDYWLTGWAWGFEGKLKKYWRTDVRNPAFFVPQGVIHEMGTMYVQGRSCAI